MPEEEMPEVQEAEPSKGGVGVASLIIAIIAIVLGGIAVALNLLSKPDTSAIEARLGAVETSVQTNADDIATVTEEQRMMDTKMEEMIDEKMMEAETTEEATEEDDATTEEEEEE